MKLSLQQGLKPMLPALLITLAFPIKSWSVETNPENAASSTDAVELPGITVTAKPEAPTGYVANSTGTATKSDTPLFDLPLSVQVVPQAVIQDQKATNLKDVLRNVSSVQAGGNGYNGLYDIFTIRGFRLGFGQSFRDGFRQLVNQVDLANIDRVEVLKGASGGLYGRIEPGGLVNIVTKKPLRDAHYSIEQRFGSFDHFRTIADATGPISQDKSLLYRMIVGYQDNGSFRDQVQSDRLLIAPSFTWDITPDTQAFLSMEYKKTHDRMDTGLVADLDTRRPINVPKERYIGLLNMPDSPTEHWLTDVWVKHEFNADWSAKIRGTWWKYNQTTFETGPNDGISGGRQTVDLYRAAPYQSALETYFTEISVNGKVNTFGLDHDLFLAGEYYNFYNSQFSSVVDVQSGFNVFRPNYLNFQDFPAVAMQDFGYQKDEWFGLTFQDTISFGDKLTVLLSGRYDSTDAVSAFCSNGTKRCAAADETKTNDSKLTPRFGINYKILPSLAVFGSYAESFADSEFGFLADGSVTKPQESNQYEAGFKGQWLDGGINASLVYFNLTKTNIVTPTIGTTVEQTGAARSQGVEFDISAQVNEHFNLIGYYAYLDTEITNDRGSIENPDGSITLTPGITGNRLPNAPRHSGSLWGKYEFDNGIGLGAGVAAIGNRAGNLDNSFDLPGYVRVDASASYKFTVAKTNISTQLNVYNLLDKDYFDNSGGGSNAFIYPGAPRTYMGSIKVDF